MMIEYRNGDLFQHMQPDGVIIHICNDIGLFGAGFALALAERLPMSKRLYADWMRGTGNGSAYHQSNPPRTVPKLGDISVVELNIHWQLQVAEREGTVLTPEQTAMTKQTVKVVNMIAQRGVRSRNNPKPIDYKALEQCLTKISNYIPSNRRIICPKIGAGLAGGKWEMIENILTSTLPDYEIVVFVV